MSGPVVFLFRDGPSGPALVPLPRFIAGLREQLTPGAAYLWVPHRERSNASERHYFACITEAFNNLPETIADRWATPKHLRKWALISAGYRNQREFACDSHARAQSLCSWLRSTNEYAVFRVNDAVVIEWTAKSQSREAMGHTDFQASKDAVLKVLAELIGVTALQLSEQGERAA